MKLINFLLFTLFLSVGLNVIADDQNPEEKVSESSSTDKKLEDKVSLEQAAPEEIENSKTIQGTVLPGQTPNDNKFSQILDVSFNTDNRQNVDGDKSYSSQMLYFLYYRPNSTYNIRFFTSFGKDLASNYKDTLGDSRVTLSHKAFTLSERLRFTPSGTVVLPTSEESKRNQELNFGIELNPSFTFLMNDFVYFAYIPRVGKNFHEYTTSRTDEVNVEYRLVQIAVANYSFIDRWYAEYSFVHSQSWAYTGTRRNPSYMSSIELGHNFSKQLVLAAGLVQGGSLIDRANGPNQTVQLFDENETTYYGKFALSF